MRLRPPRGHVERRVDVHGVDGLAQLVRLRLRLRRRLLLERTTPLAGAATATPRAFRLVDAPLPAAQERARRRLAEDALLAPRRRALARGHLGQVEGLLLGRKVLRLRRLARARLVGVAAHVPHDVVPRDRAVAVHVELREELVQRAGTVADAQ